MGRFRQQLIYLVSVLVAVNLAAGVVVLDTRIDRASAVSPEARSTSGPPPSAGASRSGSATQSGSVLAGGSFGRRRRSTGQATTGAPLATGTTGTTAPALASPATNASTRAPAVSTGGSSPSRARPAAPRAGQPTTTSTAGPGNRSTPPPAATATGEPATPDGPPPSSEAPGNAPATGNTAPAKTTTPSYSSGVWTVVDDATGDTVVDDSGAPKADARADIVQSRATNTTKAIGFVVKVAQPADPTRDPTWNSTATFVLWEVDTTGDGKPDFEIEYFVEGGKLIGGVSRLSGNGRQAACEAEAGYMSESYAVGIDPGCLGSPASLSYRATVFYAADPTNANSASITDVSPDGGMTGPVRRTAA